MTSSSKASSQHGKTSLGAARLHSSTTPALVVGSHGPATANNSMGPPAFVVDHDLAAEIVEIAVVFNHILSAINQIQLSAHVRKNIAPSAAS